MTKEVDDTPYDLFISHYQKTGQKLALIINDELIVLNKNLNIFLDINCSFDIHDLEENIKNSNNVLLLITQGVFEREFVKLELKTALKYNKNIIIVWDKQECPNFPNEKDIDEDIRPILKIFAQEWHPVKLYRNVLMNEILERIKIKSDKEKIVDLLNRKNNYKEIISSLYIKNYLDTINLKINKIQVFKENIVEIFKELEIIERKKTIIVNYNFNILILSIIVSRMWDDREKIIQYINNNEIIIYINNDNYFEMFNVKKKNKDISLTICFLYEIKYFLKYVKIEKEINIIKNKGIESEFEEIENKYSGIINRVKQEDYRLGILE